MKPPRFSTALIIPTVLVFAGLTAGVIGIGYWLYSSGIGETTESEMTFASEQTQLIYETYFDSAIDSSNAVMDRFSSVRPEDRKNQFGAFFEDLMAFKPEVLGGALYSYGDGSLITSAGEIAEESGVGHAFYEEAVASSFINVFNVIDDYDGYAFCLSRLLIYDSDPSDSVVLRLDFDFSQIVDSLSPVRLGDGGRFFIYDRDYGIVYASMNEGRDAAMELVRGLVIGTQSVELDGSHYYLYCSTISSTSWRMAIFINNESLYESLGNFLVSSLILGAVVILVFVIFVLAYTPNITRSLVALKRDMADTVSLDFANSPKLDIKGPREVRELSDSYRAMMGRIDSLVEALEKEGEEKRKSELMALQAQINPHFLYNTLDSIIGEIESGEYAAAEDMIVSLSRFFRLSISRGKNFIPVKDELEHARYYLHIQKKRFGDAIAYKFDISDGLDGIYVNKLILQPLVENSLSHGLKESETTNILIKAYTENGYLHLVVSDDGYGIPADRLQKIRESLEGGKAVGVGVTNVYRRLKLAYREGVSLSIDSNEDEGTSVSIAIDLTLMGERDD